MARKLQNIVQKIATNPIQSSLIVLGIVAIFNIYFYITAFEFFILNFFYLHIAISLTTILIPFILHFVRKKALSLKQSFDMLTSSTKVFENYDVEVHSEMNNLTGIGTLSSLLAFSGIVIALLNSSGWPIGPQIMLICFLAFVLGLSGVAVWHYLVLLIILGKYTLDYGDNPFILKDVYIQDISRTFLQVFFTGFIFYIAGVFAIYLDPLGNWLFFGSSIGYLAVFPLGGTIIVYFSVGLSRIHNIMYSIKKNRTEKINKLVQDEYKLWVDGGSVDSLEKLSKFTFLQKEISNQSEWPINFGTVLTILGSSLLPIVITLMEIFNNLP